MAAPIAVDINLCTNPVLTGDTPVALTGSASNSDASGCVVAVIECKRQMLRKELGEERPGDIPGLMMTLETSR